MRHLIDPTDLTVAETEQIVALAEDINMAMCRTLFHERLKALTGHTPQDFIRIIRLEQAAALLQQGIPVTDVSIQTGFVNSKYFSTLFKKYFGVQPSRYTGQRMNIG